MGFSQVLLSNTRNQKEAPESWQIFDQILFCKNVESEYMSPMFFSKSQELVIHWEISWFVKDWIQLHKNKILVLLNFELNFPKEKVNLSK